MAVITPTVIAGKLTLDFRGIVIIQWASVTGADTCTEVELGRYTDRTVQCEGTFGTATVTIDGTLDTVYRTLSDTDGVALSLTSGAIKAVNQATRLIRPVVTGAGATVTITLMCKGW
jgi:hypothetical protein